MIHLQFARLIKKISCDIKINEIPRNTQTTYRVEFNKPMELVKDIFKYSGYSTTQEYGEHLNFHSYFHEKPMSSESTELNHLVELLILNQNRFENIDIHDKEKIIETIKKYIIFLYQKEQKTVFDIEELKRYANELEAYFEGNERIIISKSPLDGFYSNVERIELEKGLSLQRIPLNERSEMFSRYSQPMTSSKRQLLEDEYWLINEYVPKEGINDYAISTQEEFLKFLRIFKNGSIGIHHNKLDSKYWDPDLYHSSLYSTPFTHVINNGNYIIEKDEIKQFIDLWTKYREIDFSGNGALNIAIKRFNDSFTRRDAEDRMIDLMIAFEAFFLKEDDKEGLTYKVACRTVTFLQNEEPEADILFYFMMKAYDTRSKIVHGVKIRDIIKIRKRQKIGDHDEEDDFYNLSLHKLLDRLEDIFRMSLLKYIKVCSDYQIKRMINSIDKNQSDDMHFLKHDY